MLQVTNVIDACCVFLERQLDPTNAIGIANFAEQHGCKDLNHKATQFIEQHFTQVCTRWILTVEQNNLTAFHNYSASSILLYQYACSMCSYCTVQRKVYWLSCIPQNVLTNEFRTLVIPLSWKCMVMEIYCLNTIMNWVRELKHSITVLVCYCFSFICL